MKIFGEDGFFDKEMAKFYKAQDEYVLDEMSLNIKRYMPTVVFDKEKLERWVKLCVKLDNIDNTDLINVATQKKFEELKDQLALTEKALELACEEVSGFYCSDYCGTEKDCENCWYRDYYTAEHFKTKAKEMIKSE